MSCVNDIPVSAINIATETREYTIRAQVCNVMLCYVMLWQDGRIM